MSRVRVKGFKIFKDRHGKWRCYHRHTRYPINLEKTPLGSAEFFAACEKITAIAEANKVRTPKAGTLGGLIKVYFDEAHFRELSDALKREYRMCARILEPLHDMAVASINTPALAKINDRVEAKYSWDKANRVRNFLVQVFKHCKPKGLIAENFALEVLRKPRPRNLPDKHRAWTYREVQIVLDAASPELRAALAIMHHTGLDPSDALGLLRDQMDGDFIWTARDKTQAGAEVPINPLLRKEIARAPKHDAVTILASSKGTPWTYDGLASAWQRLRVKLEAEGAVGKGLTMKGLRHTMATWLREAGKTEREISDLLAQKSPAMGLHYSRNAELGRKNQRTMEAWVSENERRSKVVKPIK